MNSLIILLYSVLHKMHLLKLSIQMLLIYHGHVQYM
jgi:hypothetical protein